jgi:ATP-dependent 26S proteasome regulatory subunit
LRFVVTFPFPGTKERKAIWERALPAQAPREGLDYERLARMNLSGGNIHSIALNAAFAAAQNGQKVTMPIVVAAARMELRKLDRPFNEAEFR